MREIAIISGKGGTGKTTIAASLNWLSGSDVIMADCDVDAANMHLIFESQQIKTSAYSGAKIAVVNSDKCTACSLCSDYCRFEAIQVQKDQIRIDPLFCEGCGLCQLACPQNAVTLKTEETGQLHLSETNRGILSHAELFPGAEGSGKLVTEVRRAAQKQVGEGASVLIDGSPGVGCPVMASITGCHEVVIVTEPTCSGLADLKRVYELVKTFKTKASVVLNKSDLNMEMHESIKGYCKENQLELIAEIPFDQDVELAINSGLPLVKYSNGPASQAITKLWEVIK